MAGLQGGLVDDPDAVGPGPDAPIDACLAFSDLPDAPLHLSVGTLGDGIAVTRCAPDHTPVAAGRAVDLVEGLTGRQDPVTATAALPADRRRAGAARVARLLTPPTRPFRAG